MNNSVNGCIWIVFSFTLENNPIYPWQYFFSLYVSVPAYSCPTLWVPMNCSLPGFSVHGIFQARNTGLGFNFLLQGILLSQGLNPHLLHLLLWQADSLPNWKSVSLSDLRTYNEQLAEQILELCFLWCVIYYDPLRYYILTAFTFQLVLIYLHSKVL